MQKKTMSFRLSHIHEYHRFVAVDVGLYRVKVGIYTVTQGKLTCTGFSSVRQSRKNWNGSIVADISGIVATIEQAMIQANHSGESIPDDIIMSFPSESFVSDSITSQYGRSHPDTTLTMNEVDMMIHRIEKESYERVRIKSRRQMGIDGDDLRLVSSTITAISVDGTRVTSPIGFSGQRVRLTVLNIFVPSGEFNIFRSIVSSLGKKAISLIPLPLILPKLAEETEYVKDKNCIIDIGYSHTTVSLMEGNEILSFATFPYGTQRLLEMMGDVHPDYSLLQIENIICKSEEIRQPLHVDCRDEFLSYIIDMIFGYLQSDHVDMAFDAILLHGTLFENHNIRTVFSELFEKTIGYNLRIKMLYDVVSTPTKYDQCVVSGLSLMAHELLLVKKDPLVRILRYVLYQYE